MAKSRRIKNRKKNQNTSAIIAIAIVLIFVLSTLAFGLKQISSNKNEYNGYNYVQNTDGSITLDYHGKEMFFFISPQQFDLVNSTIVENTKDFDKLTVYFFETDDYDLEAGMNYLNERLYELRYIDPTIINYKIYNETTQVPCNNATDREYYLIYNMNQTGVEGRCIYQSLADELVALNIEYLLYKILKIV